MASSRSTGDGRPLYGKTSGIVLWLGADAPGIRQGGVLGDALPFYRLANPANLGGLSGRTLGCASASRRDA